MLSFGMLSERAFWIASRKRAFASGSGEPVRAATVISRASLVKSWPRRAAVAPFSRFVVAHFECPDMVAFLTIRRLQLFSLPFGMEHATRSDGLTNSWKSVRQPLE